MNFNPAQWWKVISPGEKNILPMQLIPGRTTTIVRSPIVALCNCWLRYGSLLFKGVNLWNVCKHGIVIFIYFLAEKK